MAQNLQGRRIAVLATHGVEQVELTQPVAALRDAGATVTILAPEAGVIQGMNGDVNPADNIPVDGAIEAARAAEFDGILLPGGTTNADTLRMDESAVAFVRAIVLAGKPIAAICHGSWTLLEAGGVEGRRMTSWPSLKTDLRNAGADWVNEVCVVDDKAGAGGLVTSRKPDDLPDFCREIVRMFATASQREAA